MQDDFRLGKWLIQPSLNSISGDIPSTAGTPGESTRRLEPKVMQVLLCLSQRPDEVVSKEELIKAVWPGTFVTDDVLLRCISELRKALEDDAREPRFIQTISKRGYRLIAPVERLTRASDLSPVDGEGTSPSAIVPLEQPGGHTLTRARTVALASLLAASSLTIAGVVWLRLRPSPSVQDAKIVVAVLPLQNLSGDPEQEYFSEGLTEELITQLARLQPQRLAVIARTSAMQYKKTNKTIRQIGAELNAGYVVEGTVRREGSRVRVTSQLIRAGDQFHLWAESYERELSGILAVQTEIARSIVAQIRLTLETPATQQLADARPVHPDAYVAYLKGVHYMHKVSPEGHRLAAQNFEQAVKLDPTHARSWLGLGNAYRFRGTWWGDMQPREAASRAKEALARALQLDPKLGDAYAAVGWTKFAFDWDWTAAETDFRRGLELAPNSGGAHSAYGNFLRCMRRLDEALVLLLQLGDPTREVCVSRSHSEDAEDERAVVEARRGELGTFRRTGTVALLDAAPDVPVVALAIDESWQLFARNMLPVPWGVRVRVHIGEPIARRAGEDVDTVLARAREEIAATLARWRERG